MKNILSVYKPVGVTPLELIEKLRHQNPRLKNEKLGYAGRLDPMAEGVLLVLVGEKNLKRKFYEKLRKTYEFEILFGISTDSYDLLGLPKQAVSTPPLHSLKKSLPLSLNSLIGKHIQPYPPYSSPRVKGKPLFYWARAGKLADIEIPSKEIEVYDARIISFREITASDLLHEVFTKTTKVSGEFRQQEIQRAWQVLLTTQTRGFPLVKITITCSSGTYIRSVANNLGEIFQTSALAYSIKRAAVGSYTESDAICVK